MAKKSKSESAIGIALGMTDEAQTDPQAAGLVLIGLEAVIKDFDLQGGQKDENETTTLACDAKEFEAGLSDSGQVSMAGNWAQDDAGHAALMKAEDDGLLRAFEVKTKTGNRVRFLAFVKQYTYKASAGGTLAATFSLRISGKVYLDKVVA